MPWIVLDWKREDFHRIPHIQHIQLGDKLPDRPGLYHVTPIPKRDNERVEDLLWSIHARGHTGLFVDEGYQIPKSSAALQTVLTQGRALETPVILLTQRPTWMNPFAISESNFHQVFHLAREKDRESVQDFVPERFDIVDTELPDFHSHYYDVGRRDYGIMKPVPPLEKTMRVFEERLRNRPRLL